MVCGEEGMMDRAGCFRFGWQCFKEEKAESGWRFCSRTALSGRSAPLWRFFLVAIHLCCCETVNAVPTMRDKAAA
jgi:hypothetical protein